MFVGWINLKSFSLGELPPLPGFAYQQPGGRRDSTGGSTDSPPGNCGFIQGKSFPFILYFTIFYPDFQENTLIFRELREFRLGN